MVLTAVLYRVYSTLYMALAISCADLWKQSNDHGVAWVCVDADAGAKQ